MKQLHRILALLLCAVLVFGMTACENKPVATDPSTQATSPNQPTSSTQSTTSTSSTDPTVTDPMVTDPMVTDPTVTDPMVTDPTVTDPPDPEGKQLYDAARAAIDSAQDLSVHFVLKKTTKVGGQTLCETTTQKLVYSGIGTDSLQISRESNKDYNKVFSEKHKEVYSSGKAYLLIDNTYAFYTSMDAEAYLQRLIPSILLDAQLYGTIAVKSSEADTKLTFSDPSAAESWALPETAELIDASGSAKITADGVLGKTAYTITYAYGNATITLDAESTITLGSNTVQLPANAESYIPVADIDAAILSTQAAGYLLQTNAVFTSQLKSAFSQAAGAVLNESVTVNMRRNDKMAKIEASTYLMDYTTNKSDSYDSEELFLNGKYSLAIDNGAPEVQHNVSWNTVRDFCETQSLSHLVAFDYWKDASIEDLGSTYLISCTFNKKMGETLCDDACITLFDDADFLDGYATSYRTTEVVGYFAVDKYTGLPTSGGYYYEGQHTIDGYEYSLTLQSDMSIVAPALGAYKAITDEMPKEAAPETKPTPLFYHVTGDNGQEMWLFGTIHIGDERTAYLPQEIYDAFDASDALALEFDSEAFEKRMEEDEDFQDKISGYYFFSDNTLTKQHMDPELYETALKLLKATGSYNINTDYMKAYFWSSSIDDFYLRQGYQLTRDQGIEERLTTRANKQNKKILDVESGEFQVSMLSGFSDALHETLLAECVFTDPMTSWKSAKKLLDMWCAGDEAAMRKYLSTDPETLAQMSDEERALYEEYNNAMTLDRNRAMLEVAKSYLESGETVFFAVGLAHLLVDEGLVDTLRDAGYTVELVTYSE